MCACHVRRRIHMGLCECTSGIDGCVSYEEEDTYGIV
jgi:hypothetical protein